MWQVPAALVFVPAAFLLGIIIVLTQGNVTYTLDDPYIHLALAKQIWLGHYGIHDSEFSAPSSSILWPYVLAPFAWLGRFFEYVPLGLNLLCSFATAYIMNGKLRSLPVLHRTIFLTAVFFGLNVVGLVFSGMEHSLQILLVSVIGLHFVQDKPKLTFIGAMALVCAPLIRYECLAISIPVLVTFLFGAQRQLAMLLLGLIGLLVVGFSLYLNSLGLGYLPSSILAKTAVPNMSSVYESIVSNVKACGYILPLMCGLCAYYWRRDKAVVFMLLSSTALHFMFGQSGWFGRYEVYYLLFIVTLSFRPLLDLKGKTQKILIVALAVTVLCGAVLSTPRSYFLSTSYATRMTLLAASNIYYQHGQMAIIARMLNESVAVNDLGLVAFKTDQYVLDLWGLGSLEALKSRKNRLYNEDWITPLMDKHKVQYAMVYENWLGRVPRHWIKVADMYLNQTRVTPASPIVNFYATNRQAALKLDATLKTFVTKNPSPYTAISYAPK